MRLPHPGPFSRGYERIIGPGGDHADMLFEFGILTLEPGDRWSPDPGMERALLLMRGNVEFAWSGAGAFDTGAGAGGTATFSAVRDDLFDGLPTVLHLPAGPRCELAAGESGAEVAVAMTENPRYFRPRLLRPGDVRSEERGKGTMRETSTRIVRTVFDDSDAPEAMLVLGEVVGAPGKWSSYPPHHHPQPEIYHYRFLPEQGFGLTAIGNRAYMLSHGDTVLIRDTEDHPQVTAPGYAMWYLWVIRHLDGNRYITPEFTERHRWVTARDAEIWAPPSERSQDR